MFNNYLDTRVRAGTWNTMLPGDKANLDGTGSVFDVDDVDEEIERRCGEMDIHPAGELAGDGSAGSNKTWIAALGKARVEPGTRSLRLRVANSSCTVVEDAVELSFTLGRGTFATSVLRELVISPDNDFALMAALFVIAGGAFLAEKTRIGSHLTGAVIAILAAIAAANMKIIPHSAPAFDFVFSYFVPVLIPLFLFKADLRHMLFETTRMTIAFLVASVGTIIGVIIAVGLLDLSALATAADIDPELREAGIAGLFTSTYIGGSVNYAALGEITGLRTDASFFSAATATDNLFSAVFLSVLALLPGWSWLARRFTSHEHGEEMVEKQTSERISSTRRDYRGHWYAQSALRNHHAACADRGHCVSALDAALAWSF
jgi:hypothetical protein